MAAGLYTVLLDYAGGTFIAQVGASSPRTALSKWARAVPNELAAIIGRDVCLAIKAAFECDGEIVRVAGVRCVWCTSASVNDEFALVHLISTATGPPN